MCLYIFWRKEIDEKVARKILLKLTIGQNRFAVEHSSPLVSYWQRHIASSESLLLESASSSASIIMSWQVRAKNVTKGVNFTNIILAAFSYESVICSFFIRTLYVTFIICTKKLLVKCWRNWQKVVHIWRHPIGQLMIRSHLPSSRIWVQRFQNCRSTLIDILTPRP